MDEHLFVMTENDLELRPDRRVGNQSAGLEPSIT